MPAAQVLMLKATASKFTSSVFQLSKKSLGCQINLRKHPKESHGTSMIEA
jgi:hypothetical protein